MRFTVREPARISLYVPAFEEGPTRILRAGESLRYVPSAASLRRIERRLARARSAFFGYTAAVTDSDGNTYHTEGTMRVTR